MSEPTPDPDEFVTRAQLAEFLRMQADSPDATSDQLQEVLDAAIELVEFRVGPLLGATQTYTVYPNGRNLVLPATHLVSIGTVTDPHGTVLDPTTVKANLLSGIVNVPSSVAGAWTVAAATADGGASLRLAVKIIASHLWETQRGRSGGGARPGAFTAAGDGDAVPRGFAIPARALELLKPFMGPAVH